MAKNYNPGTINLDVATKSILSSGGGISEKTKADGTMHVSVYSTTENRHLSYDKDKNIKLATYASCVTKTTAFFKSLLIICRYSITVSDEAESRFPVGSSARIRSE